VVETITLVSDPSVSPKDDAAFDHKIGKIERQGRSFAIALRELAEASDAAGLTQWKRADDIPPAPA
jgi:hypothetical protein